MLDAVRTGLASALGAGLLLGIAPGAAEAGRWLLAAAVLAALAAVCTSGSVAELAAANHGESGLEVLRNQLGSLSARIAGVTALSGRVLAAAVVAGAAGWYLTPTSPLVGALVVLVVAAVAELMGARLPAHTLAAVGVPVVGVVLVVVVGACFAIPSVATPVPSGVSGADDWTGLLAASGFAAFAFLGVERAVTRRNTSATHLVAVPLLAVVLLAGYLAVAGGALHQLGGARLALSAAPLRDALAAADAAWLGQLLALGVAVAGVLVLHGLFRQVHGLVDELAVCRELPTSLRAARVPVGLGTLAVTGVLTGLLTRPDGALVAAMAVASSLWVLGWAFTNSAARLVPDPGRFWPRRVPCFGLGFSVLISVLTALDHPVEVLAVLLCGTALCTAFAATRARTATEPR